MNKNVKSNRKAQVNKKAIEAAKSFAPPASLRADALGSYTGYSEDQSENTIWDWDEGPVQDADDL